MSTIQNINLIKTNMKKRTKNVLLTIDGQRDFCVPGGALYVPGADKDMQRLSKWINQNENELDDIFVSMDSHPPIHISHPQFWMDSKSNIVDPMTLIKYDDIMNGKYIPRFYRNRAIAYVKYLEDQGKFSHIVWPEHCLQGNIGFCLEENLFSAIKQWTYKGNAFSTIIKGSNPLTEFYGIMAAQQTNEDPETQLNQKVLDIFETFENVYFSGQARSHCCAITLEQFLDSAPNLAKKLIILEDTMSDVAGSPAPGSPTFGELAQPIYDRAKAAGVRFAKTTDVVLDSAHA